MRDQPPRHLHLVASSERRASDVCWPPSVAGRAVKWASSVSQLEKVEDALEAVVGEVHRELGQGSVDLALLFLSREQHLGAVEEVARSFSLCFPNAVVLGCSAGSVIGGGREVEGAPGVSLAAARLPGVSLRPFHLAPERLPKPGADTSSWRRLVGLSEGEAPAFVLLGDPFGANTESVIGGLERAYPGSVQIGGLASGAERPGANLLFLGAHALDRGFAGVALTGDVALDTVVAQGCRPVGLPMFVTRCRENLLLEVDGRPPIEILNELYAEADARDRTLFQSSLFLGIQMNAQKTELGRGDFLVRNLVGSDPETGSLAVGALLEETQVVQFQLRDGRTAAEDLDAHLGDYAGGHSGARGVLLFSCLGRGRHMYGVPNHDSDAFRRHLGDVPVSGFFCNGEIGPVEGRTFLHGYTSAFGIFRPRD